MSGSPLQILCISGLALMLAGHIAAQPFNPSDPDTDSLSRYIQMKYGLDQELFNGFQYYERFNYCLGDLYFPENSFYKGSVSIKGIQYDDIQMKYDIYSQYLILEYTDFEERYNHIIINSIHIDSFQMGNDSYQKLSLSGEKPLFYMVLKSGPITCYIHWKKSLIGLSNNLQYSHEFSEPSGKYYIRYKGQIWPFTNKKSFISIFPDSMKREIKKYARQQLISFRRIGPSDMRAILSFIANRKEQVTEL